MKVESGRQNIMQSVQKKQNIWGLFCMDTSLSATIRVTQWHPSIRVTATV